jgi:hypothetical protein
MTKVFLIAEEHTDPYSVLFATKLALHNNIPLFIESGYVRKKELGTLGKCDRFDKINAQQLLALHIDDKEYVELRNFLQNENKVHYLQNGSQAIKGEYKHFLAGKDTAELKKIYQDLVSQGLVSQGSQNEHNEVLHSGNEEEITKFLRQFLTNDINISRFTCDARSDLMLSNLQNSGADYAVAICGIKHFDRMRQGLASDGLLITSLSFNKKQEDTKDNICNICSNTAKLTIQNKKQLLSQYLEKNQCCLLM